MQCPTHVQQDHQPGHDTGRIASMNTMMLALLQDRLWTMAERLQERLRRLRGGKGSPRAEELAATELSQVLDALEAMERGRYGLCGECECSIELDQLLAQPQRRVCGGCEEMAGTPRRALFTRLSGLGDAKLPQ
jgi:RNA polymerase-binding transcription factor DksA